MLGEAFADNLYGSGQPLDAKVHRNSGRCGDRCGLKVCRRMRADFPEQTLMDMVERAARYCTTAALSLGFMVDAVVDVRGIPRQDGVNDVRPATNTAGRNR
jgi:hypothetical protein